VDEDDRAGAEAVAVLSEPLWKRRFGGDPGVLGRTLVLSGRPTRVVGVMPAAFDFLDDDVDLWVAPAAATPGFLAERGTNNFDAIGRLRPGVSIEAARAEIVAITTRLAREYPRTNRGKIVEPMPLHLFVTGPVRPALAVLLGAVLLVALAASANVAALLLARHVARGGEYAVRLALGAGSRHLAGQVVAESLVIALAAGVVGVGLAPLVATRSQPGAGRPAARRHRGPRRRVLAFTVGLALLAALLAAAVPRSSPRGRRPVPCSPARGGARPEAAPPAAPSPPSSSARSLAGVLLVGRCSSSQLPGSRTCPSASSPAAF
jgi:hypothetical protein